MQPPSLSERTLTYWIRRVKEEPNLLETLRGRLNPDLLDELSHWASLPLDEYCDLAVKRGYSDLYQGCDWKILSVAAARYGRLELLENSHGYVEAMIAAGEGGIPEVIQYLQGQPSDLPWQINSNIAQGAARVGNAELVDALIGEYASYVLPQALEGAIEGHQQALFHELLGQVSRWLEDDFDRLITRSIEKENLEALQTLCQYSRANHEPISDGILENGLYNALFHDDPNYFVRVGRIIRDC